ncbi:hypothetical protein DAEQUDRAFT_769021 [Daedalea quercina L-15889]|uniref:Uncharacterized protein n=1 Tax=Daedalea quercina L-15889 TaxID=1314783 RepID=A0A165M5W1_9APHY|nr:hypothetical protein DAEQUDRAFT_769021 [Daedalea quercina L-15889]
MSSTADSPASNRPSTTQPPELAMSSSLSPIDLRHITSSSNLASPRERKLSNRNSQHLRTHRLGSRSPSSIPSSPTSVHSSSSAIFERDIEPITPATSLSPSSADPHRIPRGKYTEQLEQSVPSVLDSAAAVLAASDAQDDDFDAVSIITPAPPDSGYRSGLASPSSRLSSRSPSPTGISPGKRTSLLFSTSTSPPHSTSPLHTASPLHPAAQVPQAQGSPPTWPSIQTHSQSQSSTPLAPQSTVPATPTSAYYSAATSAAPSEPGSEASSPTTATHHEHPLHSLPASPAGAPQPTTITIPAPLSHPPSPRASAKRLSFISYTDLLSSTPSATMPLSSVLTNEPPHLPSVIGLPQAQYAASSSGGSVHAGSVMERDTAGQVVDDVGGEWEREGLGRGLEERLEALNAASASATPAVSGRA